ncbi:MAG: hypothetical protein JST89_10690 [Cyanobacteria bacterium SZAS-4]|nr:hypothetical protein [Cyanobacteria bacterium SZAS-4]
MRRSLIDMVKSIFYSQVNEAEPVKARVENARMTSNRLKALKPIDPTKEHKIPQAASPVDPNDPKSISKRVTTLAHMSHYRLEAYVATLPTESLEASEDSTVRV